MIGFSCCYFFSFQFKAKISKEFGDAPIEQLCLIFAGKILKDHETLAAHNVKVKRPLLTDFFLFSIMFQN